MAHNRRKTVIVTGANSGIGLEAAKGLCKLGHDVVISVRDEQKGAATVSQIKAAVPDADISFFIMEMSEPESIRSFVKCFRDTGKALHALVNNAGSMPQYNNPERYITRDDPEYEVTVTVNCMGTFLLTNLLLADLTESGTDDRPSVIVNVSSSVNTFKVKEWKFYIDDLMLKQSGRYHSGTHAYWCSKIGLNLWSNELAKKLAETNVRVNTLCPGIIPTTDLHREKTLIVSVLMWLAASAIGRWLLGTKTIEEGAARIIAMVTDETYYRQSGIFYIHCKPHPEADEVMDAVNQSKIWQRCEHFSGILPEENVLL